MCTKLTDFARLYAFMHMRKITVILFSLLLLKNIVLKIILLLLCIIWKKNSCMCSLTVHLRELYSLSSFLSKLVWHTV